MLKKAKSRHTRTYRELLAACKPVIQPNRVGEQRIPPHQPSVGERVSSWARHLGESRLYLHCSKEQPHEDGPAFRPIVATLSLGSYTILDIHHYLSTTSPSPPMTTSEAMAEEADSLYGRPIAAIPLAHLLVLPRSLLILSSSLYTAHLHGITAAEVDTVTSTPSPGAVHIANAALLGDAEIIDKLRNEGSWRGQRETRTSLTFRHAQKVLKGGVFSMVRGGLHRT